MSSPNWQKYSAGLARNTTGPTWIACTSTSRHRLLGQQGVQQDDLLGEGPLGVRRPSSGPAGPAPGTSCTRSGLGTRRLIVGGPSIVASSGARRAAVHAQQHLDRLGPHAAADDLAPSAPGRGCDVGAAGCRPGSRRRRPLEEDDDRVRAHRAADRLLQVVDPVGRDAAGAGRGVAGEVDHAAEAACPSLSQTPITPTSGSIGPGRLDDVGIALAGMRVA